MSQPTYIVLAPGRLKTGLTEKELIAASDKFEEHFVKQQNGILKRQMLRAKDGSFADLVTFENKAAADKVMEAEMSSPVCAEFFAIFDVPDPALPDMGIVAFELIKTYE